MSRYIAVAVSLITALFLCPHAQAQLAVARVVSSCGTVSPTPHVGSTYAFTMDTTGTLCSESGGGGGGGGPLGNQPISNSQSIISATNVTPNDCSGSITAGGTAQNALAATATVHYFTIANIDASAGSGEPLWISFTGTATASTAGSYPLTAPATTTFAGMGSYTDFFGTNHAVSVVAATTGHKYSCTWR
jgi:hypothetical protein